MVTIGIDPHKQTHCGVAVDVLGSELARQTAPARRTGFGQLLDWGRQLDAERVWVIEDVRNVSGSLERFLLDRGETVVRLPPRLMADLRRGARERGKSDPVWPSDRAPRGPISLSRRPCSAGHEGCALSPWGTLMLTPARSDSFVLAPVAEAKQVGAR